MSNCITHEHFLKFRFAKLAHNVQQCGALTALNDRRRIKLNMNRFIENKLMKK